MTKDICFIGVETVAFSLNAVFYTSFENTYLPAILLMVSDRR